jgi:hypothetical protein
MEIYVACDVCGHRYVLSGDREGRKSKCKSCGVPFEIAEQNFYDPETSELDEPEEDTDEPSSSPFWEISKKVGHGLAALGTLSLLVWMGSLVPGNPTAPANRPMTMNTGPMMNPGTVTNPGLRRGPQMPTTPFAPPQLPSNFQPSLPQAGADGPAGFNPPQFPQVPPQFPQPPTVPLPKIRSQHGQRGPRPRPTIPATDGSMGWPKSDPDPPAGQK